MVRTHDVPAGERVPRRYELSELYDDAPQAHAFADNDTSFTVEGTLGAVSHGETFRFTSRAGQFVTMVVVPANPGDGYSLFASLRTPAPALTAKVQSDDVWWRYINTIHVYLPKDTAVEIRVVYASRNAIPAQPCPAALPEIGEDEGRGQYRLVVIGGSEYMTKVARRTEILHEHQTCVDWQAAP
jgi:hypothetical protein